MQVIDSAFNDIKNIPFADPTGSIYGTQDLGSIAQAQIGFGTQVFRADQSGIWLGAKTFAAAPFSVDMEGNARAESLTVFGDSGQTIIDGDGIRSTSAFERAALSSSSVVSTTNTTWTDIAGSSFSITTNAGQTLVTLFSLLVPMRMGTHDYKRDQYYGEWRLYDSFLAGTAIGDFATPGIPTTDITSDGMGGYNVESSVFGDTISFTGILSVEPGVHNYKLQMQTVGGGTVTIQGFYIQIVILGK